MSACPPKPLASPSSPSFSTAWPTPLTTTLKLAWGRPANGDIRQYAANQPETLKAPMEGFPQTAARASGFALPKSFDVLMRQTLL